MIKKINFLDTNGRIIGFDLYFLGIPVYKTNFRKLGFTLRNKVILISTSIF